MVEFDQATISSYVGLVLMPVLGYFAVSSSTSSAIVGVVSAIILLLVQIWNERHNSSVLSADSSSVSVDGDGE